MARAVVSNPSLILADEPTGNLDSKNGEEVMNLLENLNNDGTTIIMVTHSSTYAERANRIVHLFDGYITNESINHEIGIGDKTIIDKEVKVSF